MDFEKCVAVDNDFIGHLLESKQPLDIILKHTQIALNDFGLSAIIHPLIYENEIQKEDTKIKSVFDNKLIETISYANIFENDKEKEEYYLFIANECLNYFHGKPPFDTIKELWAFWAKRCSLGELHSLTMCAVCSCGMFLSDDKGSKQIKDYIKMRFDQEIKTYNRKEFFSKHRDLGKTNIPSSIRRSLSHERCN